MSVTVLGGMVYCFLSLNKFHLPQTKENHKASTWAINVMLNIVWEPQDTRRAILNAIPGSPYSSRHLLQCFPSLFTHHPHVRFSIIPKAPSNLPFSTSYCCSATKLSMFPLLSKTANSSSISMFSYFPPHALLLRLLFIIRRAVNTSITILLHHHIHAQHPQFVFIKHPVIRITHEDHLTREAGVVALVTHLLTSFCNQYVSFSLIHAPDVL